MTYIKGLIRSRRRAKKFVHLDVNDEIPWGAHRNRTVRWVLAHHPSYIAWIIDKGGDPEWMRKFVFSDDVKRMLGEVKQSPNYVEITASEFYEKFRPLKVT